MTEVTVQGATVEVLATARLAEVDTGTDPDGIRAVVEV